MSYIARLRRRAVDDDAAFAEYLSEGQLVFPIHLREISVFADRHDKGLVLEPRGHAKTTLFLYRVARRIGVYAGNRRFGILTAVSWDADDRSAAVRRMVEGKAFAEIFPWAKGGVIGHDWTDKAWTVKGVELGKDHTVTAVGLGAVRAGPRLDEVLADDVVGKQENDTAGQRRKALETYLSVVNPMVVPGGKQFFLGCLATGAPILMADGTWRPIEQVSVGEAVWSAGSELGQGSPRRVEAVLDQGVRPTFRVRTRTSEIVATENHPFLVWRTGTHTNRAGSAEWVRVDALRVGDLVVEVKEIAGAVAPENDWMDESFCWLLGFLFGDGWITDGRAICVATKANKERDGKALAALREWFPTIIFRPTRFGYVRADSRSIARALMGLGLSGHAKTKRFPDWLFQAPPAYRRAFLKGLCESDGTRDGGMTDAWAVEMSNPALIEGARRLALMSGVRPGRITSRVRTIQPPHSKEPITGETFRISLNFAYADRPEFTAGRGRPAVVEDERLGTSWRLTRVESIEPDAVQQVWDLTVEGTHAFVVDGLLVHNTRWHEDDIYATFIRQGWPVLRRAALTEGKALWPDVWSAELLAAKREELGSAIYDLQYQNDPSGMGGNIFKRDWFQYVERLPDNVERRAGMDLAAGSRERSDYTSLVEVAEDADLNLYIVGCFRERLDEGHRAWLTGMTDEGLNRPSVPIEGSTGPKLLWGTDRLPEGFVGLRGVNGAARSLTVLNIEATQHQSTFTREVLAKTRLPAIAVWPDKDKVTRARTLAARYEAGKVFHLRSAPGLDDYERELIGFPNSEHDDQVDAVVYAADLNTVSEFYFTSAQR